MQQKKSNFLCYVIIRNVKILVIMVIIYLKTTGLIQTYIERRLFQVKIILGDVTMSKIQIKSNLEQQRKMLNKTGIIIIIVGQVLAVKIIEIIPLLSQIIWLVTKRVTMLSRAFLVQTRRAITVSVILTLKIIIKERTIVDSLRTVCIIEIIMMTPKIGASYSCYVPMD